MLRAKQAGQAFTVAETRRARQRRQHHGCAEEEPAGVGRRGADRRPRAPSKKPAETPAARGAGAQAVSAQGRRALRREAALPLAGSLAGQTIYLVGRLQGLTRRRLDQLVRARGGEAGDAAGRRVTTIAFGHSAAARALDDGRVALPAGLPATAALISENVLRRAARPAASRRKRSTAAWDRRRSSGWPG